MPDKTAIEHGNRRISYAQLNNASNQLALFFDKRSVINQNIAVFMERCPELVIAALGITKCGCIFVPFDTGIPENRNKVLMEMIQPQWVITTCNALGTLERLASFLDLGLNVVVLGAGGQIKEKYEHINVFSLSKDNDLPLNSFTELKSKHCYIYFTSGSTGQPKGILGRHRSLKHYIEWEIEEFGINADFNISQLTPPTFDPFLRDIFVPLCAGGTLHIPSTSDIPLDAEKLVDWLEEREITLIHTVPSIYKNMVTAIKTTDSLKSLKYILLAGEMLRGNDIGPLIEKVGYRIQLVNLYGPTETTLAKLFYRVGKGDESKTRIPVGKPISFTDVLVLDSDMNRCQVECIGEVYIRTPFISSGYINDKEMTGKVFLKNPFTNHPQDIIYKTGDMGKINQDGSIELVGRIDDQVKIRGVRIELQEIENKLMAHENISDTVIVANENDQHEKYLCAYYVENDKILPGELRRYLMKHLPEYMVPSYFLRMDSLPLNVNGKIDRKLLPPPETSSDAQQEYIAPQDSTQEKLVSIWEEVLHKSPIGISDDFFVIGGHSLKAGALVSAVSMTMDVQLSIKDIFTYPTVREMAEHIKILERSGQDIIEHVENKEAYPVSPTQRRLYILSRLDENSVYYNMPFAIRIQGELDRENFDRAIRSIIERHEVLRSSFDMDDGRIIQRIAGEVDFKIHYTEFSENGLEKQFSTFIRPFSLDKAPLIRVCLAKTGDSKYIVMFDMHHIISDGASIGILINEFIALYSEADTIPELTYQYKDYAVWQNHLLNSGEMNNQKEYWMNVFKGEIPVLHLPEDFPRPAVQNFEGDSIEFEFSSELTDKIKALAAKEGSTLYMLLLAAFNVLLMKYSGQEDIVIGSPVSSRERVEFINLVGMFVNTLAMRNRPEGSKSFLEFLGEVRENTLMAFDNRDFQFEELVEVLDIQRNLSRNPLFDVMLVLHNYDRQNLVLEGLSIKEYRYDQRVSKFDIVLAASEYDGVLKFDMRYRTRIFKRSSMEKFAQHFMNLLKEVINHPNIMISDISLLSSREKEQILDYFNDTASEFPAGETINGLFQAQATIMQDYPAVFYGGQHMTYRQLNAKSNSLARVLRAKGVVADSIVALICRRSFDMVVGIMAILKAGGAYLPIDPDCPEERVSYILKDSSAEVLLLQSDFAKHADLCSKSIYLDYSDSYAEDDSDVDVVNGPQSLAYVIYTSGSTGKPKGVMVEHRALINRLNWMQKKYPINQQDIILQKTPYTFDVSVWELLWWSLQGASVCMLAHGGEKNPEEIVEAVEKYGITTMHFVPSMLKSFLCYIKEGLLTERLKSLKRVFSSGEALSPTEANQFDSLIRSKLGTALHNLYGPTEATIDVTYFDCPAGEALDTVPIGKPIDNIKLLILDKYMCLQPVGVPGELYIAGVGLARGYMNRPELTRERFVPNPYSDNDRMYKSGDLARWLPDGNIEYLGRTDHQVKIRGNRIELGEIETALRNNSSISDAVVIPKEDNAGDKVLCGYIVSTKDFTITEIKTYLGRLLPEYMMPSYVVRLDKLPLSPNGKIDRKALPEPLGHIHTGVEYLAPSNDTERQIAELWKEVLGIDVVGMEDNFFDLGGNSLRLVELYSKLEKAYPGRFKIADLFSYTKVSLQAGFLKEDPDTQVKFELRPVLLPQDYFIDSVDSYNDGLLTFTIDANLYEKIKFISAKSNVHSFSVLLAAYMYLLSDISQEGEVSVAALSDDRNSLLFPEVNIHDAQTMESLFQMVDLQCVDNSVKGAYPIQQMRREILTKGGRELYSLVCNENAPMNVVRSIFDIVMEVMEEGEGLRVGCQYNAGRLKADKVEILLTAYIKLLKIITQ
jgi:amino acid adenylation domain-containing protein